MLHIIYGTDENTKSAALTARIKAAQSSGTSVTRITGEDFQPGLLSDALGAKSLFGETTCYILDTPSSEASYAEDVAELLPLLAASLTQFILVEGKLLAPERKRYEKYGATLEEYNAEKEDRFNTFILADALAARDKRTLWLRYHEARAAGSASEEIIGILWWQLKALRLATQTQSAAAAGMKDFPYQKAKRALGAFPTGELERLSRSLLTVYHDGHAGLTDIDLALERWCLLI
jgi:DNA polymerase III delta subunit